MVLLGLGSLLAQEQGQLLGTCRSPEGDRVTGAEVLVLGDAEPAVAILADRARPLPTTSCRTDEQGDFRCAVGSATATVLVRHVRGLGGVMARAAPGASFRLELQPMGELNFGGEEFELHAAIVDPVAGRRHLPVLRSQRGGVRLPAGRYELWVRVKSGWSWLSVELRSSDIPPLALPAAPARRLARAPGTNCRVWPKNWPDTVLLDDATAEVGLFTTGPIPLVVEDRQGQVQGCMVPDGTSSWQAPLLARPEAGTEIALSTSAGGKAAGAEVWVLRQFGDEFEPIARTRSDAEGKVRVALPDPARCVVLALHEAHVPTAVTGDRIAKGSVLVLDQGRKLRIQCSDGNGPVAGAVLELAPADMPEAAIAVTCDHRGFATVLHAPTAGSVLTAVDTRYANQRVEVGASDSTVRVQLTTGARVTGRVRTADGSSAAGVAVTIRDPSGRMRPKERSTVADAKGQYSFGGLPEQGTFILFAQQQRAGRTWSGKVPEVTAGKDQELELRCEDPELRGR